MENASQNRDIGPEPGQGDGTVGKALRLLDQVAAFGRPVRFHEVQALGLLPKATLYRLLQTLTSQGMLAYDPDRQVYSLGLRLIRLAHDAWRHASLAPIARPHLDALSAALGETVHLAQLDAGQVLYVDKRNARAPLDMFAAPGKVGPAYCTGVGKAMLAFLDAEQLDAALTRQAFYPHTAATHRDADALRADLAQIRQTGISFDREEHEPRIICVAVPVLSASGRVLGGLSVTSSTPRHSLEELAGFATDLRRCADAIAAGAAGLISLETKQYQGAGP